MDDYAYLKENVYTKMKRKLLLFPIKVEYNIISSFLLSCNTIKTFFQKEINNTYFQTSFLKKKPCDKNSNEKNKEDNYCDFILLNNEKSENNDCFKVKSIYNNHCLNHSILILRFIKKEASKNTDIENMSSKFHPFLDLVISFYIDISDNSTILINELFSNLSDSLFVKFNKIVHFFYQKLQIFVREKMNKYICFESILIQKNVEATFNYLYSCKICHNEKIQIKKIEKINQDIEITCEIGSLFPVNICETKLFIKNISKESCIILIVNWMNTSDFKTQGKLLNIKSIIALFLRKFRCRLNSDGLEKKKEIKK